MWLMRKLNFNSCVYHDGLLWFVTQEGFFMKMDVVTLKTSYVPLEPFGKRLPCVIDRMMIIQEKIYWINQFGTEVVEYDMKHNDLKEYYMPKMEVQDWACVAAVATSENKILIYSRHAPGLITFDLLRKTFEVTNQLYEELSKTIIIQDNDYWYTSTEKNKELYLFRKNDSYVGKIQMAEGEQGILRFDCDILGVRQGVWKDDKLYTLCQTGTVYEWDENLRLKRIIYDCGNNKNDFSRIIVLDDKMFMLPICSKKILEINLNNLEINAYSDFPEDLLYENNDWCRYTGYDENLESVWFANRSGNYILKIDKIKQKIVWERFLLPDSEGEASFFSKQGIFTFTESDVDINVLPVGSPDLYQ